MSLSLESFIAKWAASGAAERANKDSFLRDLCNALDAAEARALQPHKVRREDGEVTVSVPDDRAEPKEIQGVPEARESIKVQALLAQVGERMGFRVWIPAPDRAAVLKVSYDSIRELASVKHLEHLSDSVLEEYEEEASA